MILWYRHCGKMLTSDLLDPQVYNSQYFLHMHIKCQQTSGQTAESHTPWPATTAKDQSDGNDTKSGDQEQIFAPTSRGIRTSRTCVVSSSQSSAGDTGSLTSSQCNTSFKRKRSEKYCSVGEQGETTLWTNRMIHFACSRSCWHDTCSKRWDSDGNLFLLTRTPND